MKALVLALSVWAALSMTPATADNSLFGVGKLLAKESMICANFTQSKSLRALKRPLVSKGRFVFIADKGILWRVLEPFPAQVLVKKDALIRWDDAGNSERLGFDRTPVFAALSRVFLRIFTSDISSIKDVFKMKTEVKNSSWRMTLTPIDVGFASIIARVHIAGGRFVEELRIDESRGDRTFIKFEETTTQSCQLDTAEKGYFAH